MSNNDSAYITNVKNTLTELGNIGAGNASTSLSVLLKSMISVSPPEVKLCDFRELENAVGISEEEMAVGVFSTIDGEIDAVISFIMPKDDAENLVKMVLGDDVEWNSDIGKSAISEISNILIGSYVGSLENLTNAKVRYTLPEICIDMLGAILSVPYIEFSQISDKSLLLSSEFKVGDYKIDGHIIMISSPHSFDKLMDRLGVGGAV
ncbi:MAG: chemotaxis protein CheC [Lachnospiraceae bacterium]|nr:chemotaxis protein CheC [Lachnospiraceae bacterium]